MRASLPPGPDPADFQPGPSWWPSACWPSGLLLLGLWAARPGGRRGGCRWRGCWPVVPGPHGPARLAPSPCARGVRHIMAGAAASCCCWPGNLLLRFFVIRDGREDEFRGPSIAVPGRNGWAQISEWKPLPNSSLSRPVVASSPHLVSRISYFSSSLAVPVWHSTTSMPIQPYVGTISVIRFIETQTGNRRRDRHHNNAVLLPPHEHYRRRPTSPSPPCRPTQFATGQEPELAALARDYDRIWFITDPRPTDATTTG